MAKFKMPPHPIYLGENGEIISKIVSKINGGETDIDTLLDLIKRDKPLTDNPSSFTERMDAIASVVLKPYIGINGHILLKFNGTHWDESVSEKTIRAIPSKSFKLPYTAFAIDLSHTDWSEEFNVVFVAQIEDNIIFSFDNTEEKSGERDILVLSIGNSENSPHLIGDYIDGWASSGEQGLYIYKILSLIMYCSLFKKERNRVDIRQVKARKTKNGSSYRINEVRLIQPEYALYGVSKGDSRNKSDKERQSHIVKGHFRSQPYGKREEGKTRPVWIAPFWKGKAREQATKIIKI